MDLSELKEYLDNLSASLSNHDRQLLTARLSSLASAFPFSEYDYILMFLLDREAITFLQYEDLRDNYVSANRNLQLFELAPRVFGEIWAHQHLIDLDNRFVKPSKTLDADYEGQYDLWIQGVRVEVKSGRAINTEKRGSLVSKALRHQDDQPFWMNYQQLKLDVADVFVFIGVWVDTIVYWVLSNEQVKNNEYRSHQHRGGIEYQIGVTQKNISEFDRYKVAGSEIGHKVLESMKSG